MMATVKVREALRRLVADGWVQTRQCGSHRQFSHPTKPGVVTIAGKPSDTLAEGTWLNIQRQAGWRT
jgi:predicted RNA binding protein YcfA (HicA-like mRNA interferase family)